MSAGGAQVDLTTLTVDQLQEIRKQLDQELEYMTNSHMQLRQAKAKFLSCTESVKQTFKASNDGKQILVPLTSSLYVPANIHTDPKRVIVDIGTGYFIEKNSDDAVAFYTKKVGFLDTNLTDLEKIINAKGQNIQTVTEVMTAKMRQEQMSSAAAA
ncbi:Probable prefoldin subunit 5 [Taphrina deformans PYCC 5710]|uniref:Probable prefoldin subunit 5 n=1 Tax=Taphrina deformans (strain PYCC 5710 / ATCC 11124 / CBS 356.35 / IMI 108563 / JCM 9778 / NBRC 8474) TaxID=1097556 RepID=R4X988_TAPDE|nr:Probable prefoldin subunit 5 [Taphrina deformans PYCC 5710]|eukprot:CCG82245.1 Probable prefoldin subunit 5 [Taphrina deformans PYCC 5710]